MPVVDCLIIHSGHVLLARKPQEGTGSAGLSLVSGQVEPGESPLEACAREVREWTGFHANPSCVALISNLTQGHQLDYHLAFVVEAPQEALNVPLKGDAEWVLVDDLPGREDVPALERELLPQLLGSHLPVSVVIEIDSSTEPHTKRLVDISPIELARLSPLVFAITS